MADTVGELKIALSFDKSKFQSSQKEVEKETSSWGSKLASGAGKVGAAAGKAVAAGVAVGSAAVAGLMKQATGSFAEYQQLVGGVETLFKDASGEVMENANKAFETAGLSANEYMNTVTSFSASLLQSVGGNTSKAAKLADQAVIDMADNANKMGTSMEAIQNAYQGFAKQNYTMLDNLKLGYGGTKTEMERLLADAEKLTGKKFDISNFGDITEAIHAIQVNMGIAGTTAQEGTETISGSLNSLKSAWQNTLTGMANGSQDMGKLVDNLVSTAKNFIKNIVPVIKTAAKGIGTLVKELAPVIAKELPKLVKEILPDLLKSALELVQALAKALPDILIGLIDALVENVDMIVDTIVQALMALVDHLPELIQGAIKLIVALAVAIIQRLPQIIGMILKAIVENLPVVVSGIINGFVQLFGAAFQALGSFFEGIWNGLVAGAQGAWQGIQNIFGGIAEWFGSVFRAAWQAVKAVFETGGKIFTGIVDGIVKAFKTIVNGIITGINAVVAVPFNAINGVLKGLKAIDILGIKPFDWVGTIAVPQIPKLAQGGYASGASQAVIGEAGPEVVLPLSQNTDNWSGLLANALAEKFNEEDRVGGGITIENQNFNISSQLDAENIGHIMMQSIRRQAR